jgi:hypothetical protein
MTGVSKIEHKNQEILFINYEGTSSEEDMIAILKESQKIIIEDNKEYLQLTNMKNAFATSGFMTEVKKVAKDTPKLAKKRAIVGVDSPARKILLKTYNFILGSNAMKTFDTIEEAKDWLVR